MELFIALGKGVLLVPVWALIQSPLLRFSAKLAKTANVSLKAAFVLGLIANAACALLSVVFYFLSGLMGERAAEWLYVMTALIAAAWLYGYFLRTEAGTSIGMWRGFLVLGLEAMIFLGILLAAGLLFVLVVGILG